MKCIAHIHIVFEKIMWVRASVSVNSVWGEWKLFAYGAINCMYSPGTEHFRLCVPTKWKNRVKKSVRNYGLKIMILELYHDFCTLIYFSVQIYYFDLNIFSALASTGAHVYSETACSLRKSNELTAKITFL